MGVSGNSMPKKLLGLISKEVTGDCRKVHNEELYDCTVYKMVRVIKSSKIRRAGALGTHKGKINT